MAGGRDFGDLLEALENLDLEAATGAAIDQTLDDMVERNKEQLLQGETSQGGNFARYRNPDYADYKNALNPRPGWGNPDFYLTGETFATMRGERVGDEIHIHFTGGHKIDLEKRDGADYIYGLGQEEHNDYVQLELEPALVNEVRKTLRL